ncbi:DNA polymerase III subunit psi [Agarivorans sp. DSG3-1]|uniref:DNA polymerase III subunit psi n=1 Tax=Agarivorans sp. DSG3-1 TaxID=3342249 RepID=UPI00398EA640
MIDKKAHHYLQEMGIDVWLTRETLVAKPLQELPAWPLVVVINAKALQQHLDLFKGIVAAMKFDWADIHCTSAEHFPEGYQGWVLWAEPSENNPQLPQLLRCDPEQLANNKQAKRILWQQICSQILNQS